MEIRKHSTDNFERFLKDKADEFRMYPSRRVWYSIYNNMHPGNRFPSVSMAIVLTGLLFLVGYLNTSEVNKTISVKTAPANNSNTAQTVVANNRLNSTGTSTVSAASVSLNQDATLSTLSNTANINSSSSNHVRLLHRTAATSITVSANSADIDEPTTVAANDKDVISLTETANDLAVTAITQPEQDLNAVIPEKVTAINLTADEKTTASPTNNEVEKTAGNEIAANIEVPKNTDATPSNKIITPAVITSADKGWIEDYGMHNRPPAKPWAGKLTLQAYITPSVVYRKLRNNVSDKVLNSGNIVAGNQNVNDIVNHKPSIGIETGVALQYDFTRRIKLKAGVQLNYTRYNAHAFATGHPVSTSIMFNGGDGNSMYESFRTSDYSNAYGLIPAKLHNETYQFSIPLGADVRIASLDNISWYAGATIQPTLVLYGKSYVISTDKRYYVNDPSLLNRFNVNAGFETYVSYKTQSGYTWQLGPQYRTQLFSTNTRNFAVEERLQNFGFKIGVLKRL